MTTAAFLFAIGVFGLAGAWASAALLYPVFARLVEARPGLARGAVVVAAVPWLLGAALVVSGLFPGDHHVGLLGRHAHAAAKGWAHLCSVHSAGALALVPAALTAALVFLPGRLSAWRRLALDLAEPGRGGPMEVVDLPRPTAMLLGWRRPSVVVDRRLWDALEPEQRRAVVAHEQAHLARRDPAVLLLLRALTSIGPAGARRRLLRAWLQRAELCADARAADEVGDPLVVAVTLLRCARLHGAPALALGWSGGSLEHRIERLLAASPGAPPADRPDLDRRDVLLLLALSVAVPGTTPWVHHTLEHLLNLPY